MRTLSVTSDTFAFRELSSDGTTGSMTLSIDVPSGVRAMYATLCHPETGAPVSATDVKLSLVDPSGRQYAAALNYASVFVSVSGGSFYAAIFLAPSPGNWSLSIVSRTGAAFRATLHTVPSSVPLGTLFYALADVAPVDQAAPLDTYEYQLFRWALWSASAAIAAAAATPHLAFDLPAFVDSLIADSGADPQATTAQVKGLTVDGVMTALARAAQVTTPNIEKQVLGGWTEGIDEWREYQGLHSMYLEVPSAE